MAKKTKTPKSPAVEKSAAKAFTEADHEEARKAMGVSKSDWRVQLRVPAPPKK